MPTTAQHLSPFPCAFGNGTNGMTSSWREYRNAELAPDVRILVNVVLRCDWFYLGKASLIRVGHL